MFSKSAAFGLTAWLFMQATQLCHGGLSDLYRDLTESDDGDTCVLESCLYLGDEDVCWYAASNSSEAISYIENDCDEFRFYSCDYEDWVWPDPDDIDCWDCPSCSCSEQYSVEYHSFEIGGFYKECEYCYCDSNDNDDLYWNCWTANRVYWYEDNYDLFACPFNDTKYSCEYDGDSYEYGEYFMTYDSDNEDDGCQTFCYCGTDGTVTCETGFSNIVANDDLAGYFYEDCEYYLQYCQDSPDTWVYDTTTSYSCSCPRCGCNATLDSMEDGYLPFEYASTYPFEITEYGCAYDCECNSYSYYSGAFIDDCDYYDTAVSNINCPPTLECASVGSTSWTDNGTTYSYLYSDGAEGCVSSTEGYCANWIQQDFGFYDGETYTGQNAFGGCLDSVLCLIGDIDNNECVYYDVDFTATVTDCDDEENDYEATYTQDLSFTEYLSCCTGDFCNNATLDETEQTLFDTSTCSKSDNLGTLFSDIYSCVTSESIANSVGHILYCDSEDWYESMTVCEYLEYYILGLLTCYCDAMADLYPSVGSTAQSSMQTLMDNFITEQNTYIQSYECELSLSCDLSDGSVSITYTQYEVTFDLTLSSYNQDSTESEIKSYISSVVGITTGSIELSNVVGTASDVSMEVTVTFETQDEADQFSTDLEDGDVYDFGDDSTVSDVSDAETVSNVIVPETNAAFGLKGNYNGWIIMAVLVGIAACF